MKKVMFMIESMIVGGAEKALINIANNLDKNKYDVTVLSMYKYSVYDGYDHNFKELFDEDVKVKYLIDNSKSIRYRLFNCLYNRLPKSWFYKFFIKENYDIEVAFYEGFPTTFLSNSTNIKSKKLAWLHTDSKNAFGSLGNDDLEIQKSIYNKFDSIVGVSKSVVDSFNKIFNLEEKTAVQYNILDNENILKKSKEEIDNSFISDKFKMITVGRLIPIKGYDRLLRCVKNLKNDGFDFELWIVGDGSEKSYLEKYIEDNNLQNNVKLLGFQENPYKYIDKCDLFVCSSIAEGFSTVATEALILNKPIVTTNCSGMEELFGDFECGIITDNNEDSLYLGLNKVLSNKQFYNKLKLEIPKRSDFFDAHNRLNEIENIL